MNNTYTITKTKKFKSLSFEHYEYITREITKHYSIHGNKKRNTGRTALIKSLAFEIGTSASNIYTIINDASITIMKSDLKTHQEYSASAAFAKRNKKGKTSNACKLKKAKQFISLVVAELKANKLSSIDETINYLILHQKDKIEGLETVCVKTFYNYVHACLLDIRAIDLPRTVQRKKVPKDKDYIPKGQKGVSITQRPFAMDDRSEFGHWEGDLVTGPRDGKNGALLTLIERQTRFYYMIPIKAKTSKQVLMKINQLNKLYGDQFTEIFKSITFDNGSEFARYKDMGVKPGARIKRTSIYFGRPYRSSDRGSNENCNGLVRYYIKKGTDINKLSKDFIKEVNDKINDKKRKLHGYQPSSSLFLSKIKEINTNFDEILYI